MRVLFFYILDEKAVRINSLSGISKWGHIFIAQNFRHLNQRTLTEGEGLLVLTGLDQLILKQQTLLFFYKTTYLNEEVNRTEPSPSVSVPCPNEQGNNIEGKGSVWLTSSLR
jgi:hypothetical protein